MRSVHLPEPFSQGRLCLEDAQQIRYPRCSSKACRSSNIANPVAFRVTNGQNKNFRFLQCYIEGITILTDLLWNWSVRSTSLTVPEPPTQKPPGSCPVSFCSISSHVGSVLLSCSPQCPTCRRVQDTRSPRGWASLLCWYPIPLFKA